MSELTLTNVHKSYGDHQVLAGLDLSVPSGSFTALLGASGAGKTTLLRLLAGFDAPDAGTITVAGTIVADDRLRVAPERRRIGYVPQEGSLFPHLTVGANIGFGLPRRERAARSRELLDMVGLTGLERRYPHQLSGGQQQRVALARALAVRPEVVLLDEPFAALDENLREGLRAEVRRILKDTGTTTLLVTHNQDEALSTADRVAVIRDGHVVQHAPPHELYTQPVDDQLATFLGAANLVSGTYQPDGIVLTPLGPIPAHWAGNPPPAPATVTTLIRPEQITLASAASGHGSIGRVLRRSFHGHDTLLEVQLEQAGQQPILVRTLGATPHAPGDTCSLTATGTGLVWLPITNNAGVTPQRPTAAEQPL
jgi:iron(III) transport system ATP-binding protein